MMQPYAKHLLLTRLGLLFLLLFLEFNAEEVLLFRLFFQFIFY